MATTAPIEVPITFSSLWAPITTSPMTNGGVFTPRREMSNFHSGRPVRG